MIPSSLPCTHYYYRFNLPSIKSFTVTAAGPIILASIPLINSLSGIILRAYNNHSILSFHCKIFLKTYYLLSMFTFDYL